MFDHKVMGDSRASGAFSFVILLENVIVSSEKIRAGFSRVLTPKARTKERRGTEPGLTHFGPTYPTKPLQH